MTLCLTDDELAHVTGSPMPRLQMEWLDRQGWTYVLSRRGRPVVARAHFETAPLFLEHPVGAIRDGKGRQRHKINRQTIKHPTQSINTP